MFFLFVPYELGLAVVPAAASQCELAVFVRCVAHKKKKKKYFSKMLTIIVSEPLTLLFFDMRAIIIFEMLT